jgi:deazaflavin-dependent oxidoreductase (nitroreductase family)
MTTLQYVDPTARRSLVYRAWARLAGWRPMGWFSRAVVWRLDPYVMRATRGRIGLGGLLPTAVLETRGAKSGQPRSNVLVYFHDGDDVILVASMLGMPKHPAWFHNARANGEVVFGGQPFRVEVVEDEAERTRVWALADNVFPPYASYRRRAAKTGRTIPLLRLVPRG